MALDRVYYTYCGKGGKAGKRELPLPAYDAIKGWLAATGRSLKTMAPDASLWPDTRTGRGITSGTFDTNLRRYLRQAGLPLEAYTSSATAAKLRRDAGESVEEVSRFLDHSSLAVTTTYLGRLEGMRTRAGRRWPKLIGVMS